MDEIFRERPGVARFKNAGGQVAAPVHRYLRNRLRPFREVTGEYRFLRPQVLEALQVCFQHGPRAFCDPANGPVVTPFGLNRIRVLQRLQVPGHFRLVQLKDFREMAHAKRALQQ